RHLERPHGRLRNQGSREGHLRHRQRHRGEPILQIHHRRRRQREGRQESRRRRQVHLHLHRRRRQPRTPRGQGTPRRCRLAGQVTKQITPHQKHPHQPPTTI